MRLVRTLLVAASLVILSGCITGLGYGGFSGGVYSGPNMYAYPGWPGYYADGPYFNPYPYGFRAYPGPYFGAPYPCTRFQHPGYRAYPHPFGYGPRWGKRGHFRR